MHADAIPTAKNSSGIYALTARKDLPDAEVVGEVALSGAVVVGEYGYRAQTATIRSLYVRAYNWLDTEPDGLWPPPRLKFWPPPALIAILERRYGVEVTIVDSPSIPRPYGVFPGQLQILNRPYFFHAP